MSTLKNLLIAFCSVYLSFIFSVDAETITVDVWQPPFNQQHTHQEQSYQVLSSVSKKWRICVAIPHLKDTYWLAVNHGLINQAKFLGISLNIFSAGGYENYQKQIEQLTQCFDDKYDGVILASVKVDGFDDALNQFKQANIPVIDLINTVNSPYITARAAADYYELAFRSGEFLSELNGNKQSNVLWLPGPEGAGWSIAGNNGFEDALKGSNISIAGTLWGDTGTGSQSTLIRRFIENLADKSSLNYIVGNAVAAESAVNLLRRYKLTEQVKVLSYYFSPGVYRGITRGYILSAPSDVQGWQAQLSVDLVVKALEKKSFPKHIGYPITMFTQQNIHKLSTKGSMAPSGFRPIFKTE